MRNKKLSLINVVKKECSRKVRICTNKFCIEGCLIENYDDDDIVCIENAKMIFDYDKNKIEKRDTVCICDDHIIAFEVIK